MVERIRYDAYGRATHRWPHDFDDDGYATLGPPGDYASLFTLAAGPTAMSSPSYDPNIDLNRDGIINADDDSIWSTLGIRGPAADGEICGRGYNGVDNVVGYCGYIFAPEITGGTASQKYCVRFRWYDPVGGRWLERDPAGFVDGTLLYQYVHSRPSRFLDPWGLAATNAPACECGPPDDELDEFKDMVKRKKGDPEHNRGRKTEAEEAYERDRIDSANEDFARLGRASCALIVLIIPGPLDEAAIAAFAAQRGLQVAKGIRAVRLSMKELEKAREAFNKAKGLVGQDHHAISKTIHEALEKIKNMKGKFKCRDDRYLTKAKELMDHKGYQKWHREYDKDIAEWITKQGDNITEEKFIKYLNSYYQSEHMAKKFPGGITGIGQCIN